MRRAHALHQHRHLRDTGVQLTRGCPNLDGLALVVRTTGATVHTPPSTEHAAVFGTAKLELTKVGNGNTVRQAAASGWYRCRGSQLVAPTVPASSAWDLGVFLLLSAAVLLLNSQYKQSTLRLKHGAFVLTRVDPVSSDTLFLNPDARKIRIVDVNGEGSVTVRLTSAESDVAILKPMTDWSLRRVNDQEYFYKEFHLTGSTPGVYRLEFEQTKGWGWYEWTLSQGASQERTLPVPCDGHLAGQCFGDGRVVGDQWHAGVASSPLTKAGFAHQT